MMKTIFITGSTDGIGKLAALKLALNGHRILVHGRNEEKLKAVVTEIKSKTNNEKVHGFTTDLSELDQLSRLADQLGNTIDSLDVLINNAGVYNSSTAITKDHLDIRFAVNYLAPVVLTRALKPLLEKSTDARIINLSSAAQAAVSLTALAGDASLGASQAYAQSKLALTMWSFHLAKSWPFATIIALNPGSLLNTNMVKEAFGRHWSPAEKGGDVLCDLALSESFANQSGKYFDNDQGSFNQAHPDAYDASRIGALLRATEKILS